MQHVLRGVRKEGGDDRVLVLVLKMTQERRECSLLARTGQGWGVLEDASRFGCRARTR